MDDAVRRNLNVSRRIQHCDRCGEFKISFSVSPYQLHRLPLSVAKSACNCCNRLYSLNVYGLEITFLPLYILVNTSVAFQR